MMAYGWRRIFTVAVFAALAGCAALPRLSSEQAKGLEQVAPRAAEIRAVPFFPQEDFQCGPAALAEVLRAAGVQATPEQIVPLVYLPSRKGTLQVELIAAARRFGTIGYTMTPDLVVLLREIAAGTPVLVLQNLSLQFAPQWHYAVVVGYDLDRRVVILRSGRTEREELSLVTFDRTWARSERWAMVAAAPNQLPATAAEATWLSAVVASEKVGQIDAARVAYGAALARWPDSLGASIGLANMQHAERDYAGAERTLSRAVEAHPDSVPAWNNLAEAYLMQRRYPEALSAARRAVDLGGPLAPAARATLSEIEARGYKN